MVVLDWSGGGRVWRIGAVMAAGGAASRCSGGGGAASSSSRSSLAGTASQARSVVRSAPSPIRYPDRNFRERGSQLRSAFRVTVTVPCFAGDDDASSERTNARASVLCSSSEHANDDDASQPLQVLTETLPGWYVGMPTTGDAVHGPTC